ncbi:MAG: hypothetical protein IPN92_00685 [Chromatiaceae bacterium]|nr:hypothetical protein [Chromatiaceae bacterium]
MKGSNPIASLFGHSLFKPVHKHRVVVGKCVAEVPDLFEPLIANDKVGIAKAKDIIFARSTRPTPSRMGCAPICPRAAPLQPPVRFDFLFLSALESFGTE